MRNLQETQKHFQNYLLHQNPAIKSAIISTENACATTRLEIYRHAYYHRLIEAIEEDFPGLRALIGPQEFHELLHLFIDRHPSHFRSLRWYAGALSAFLKETKPYSDYPWFAEMAEFEWLLVQAFDAADRSYVTVDDMAAVPFEQWPQLRFTLHPSLCILNLSWNVVAIWQAFQEDLEPPMLAQSDLATWIVWRKELHVQFCTLTVDEAFVILAMQTGHSFSEVCEGLCEWIDEQNVAMHAALLLKRFILDGLIVKLDSDMPAKSTLA